MCKERRFVDRKAAEEVLKALQHPGVRSFFNRKPNYNITICKFCDGYHIGQGMTIRARQRGMGVR